MSRINRYLLQYFIRILSLCTAAFIGIYLLIDFFEKVEDFVEHGAALSDYLGYLLNSIPFILSQILPLAILTSVVLTLGGLGRSNEITAMRACGIGLWKIVKPLMGLTLLFSLLLLLLNEFVVPWNNENLNQLLEVKLKGKKAVALTHQQIWYRDGQQIINIALAKPQQQQLVGLSIFQLDEQQRIRQRIMVEKAIFKGDHWQGEGITSRRFDPLSGDLLETVRSQTQPLQLGRQPDDFARRKNINDELNLRELISLSSRLKKEGYDATRQQVDLHARIAAPFTCLIMGFLGVPFALQRGRNSNLALGIGLSLAIGILYFIIASLVTSLGYSAALPPFVAAWAANLLFLMLGIWLLLSVRE